MFLLGHSVISCLGCVQRNDPKWQIPLIEPIVVTLAH